MTKNECKKMIRERLFAVQDEKYADFTSALIPNVERKRIIGVRSPEIKKLAAEFSKNEVGEIFISSLPHKYLEENHLHAAILARENDYLAAIEKVKAFLPFIDNWATCDTSIPKAFKKNKNDLLGEIHLFLQSEHAYTVRYAIGLLMKLFLDEDFREKYLNLVANIKSEEYYVNMMRAWYFATALAKQYDSTIPLIESKTLDTFTHNKSIQKAVESFRVSDEHKAYLKTLKK